MKILHLNTNATIGGAAKAANRLNVCLRNSGIDSKMLVLNKRIDDSHIIGPKTKTEKALNLIRPSLEQLPLKFCKKKSNTLFNSAWLPFSGITSKINQFQPDIIHFHWIAGGLLSLKEIRRIKTPIVWTLHDMWAFTGGCHYDNGCGKYTDRCGACPELCSERSRDLSRINFSRKKKVYDDNPDIVINCLSSWISDCVKSSSLLNKNYRSYLPNPIDLTIFHPIEKMKAREILNIPKNKNYILFGAINATDDPRKGFDRLTASLEKVQSENIELIVFGSDKPRNPPYFPFPVHYLGKLHDEISLCLVYSAANVMVIPSSQEVLVLTALESFSCGTPVAAFRVSGFPDIVEHKINGYLAEPFDTNDLAKGIDWIIADQNTNEYLGKAAREKAEKTYDASLVARQYIDLYHSLIT